MRAARLLIRAARRTIRAWLYRRLLFGPGWERPLSWPPGAFLRTVTLPNRAPRHYNDLPMASVFSRIIAGELPAHFVWQDDQCVTFMSIRPLRPGHVLVVPRAIVGHWIDLEDDLLAELMRVARTIARAQQVVYRPTRVGLLIGGLEVAHVHVHVSPIDGLHDMDFASVGPNPGDGALAAKAARFAPPSAPGDDRFAIPGVLLLGVATRKQVGGSGTANPFGGSIPWNLPPDACTKAPMRAANRTMMMDMTMIGSWEARST